MSDDTATLLGKADWVEELQRKVFEECAAQSRQGLQEPVLQGEDISESSVTATSQELGDDDVPVAVIVDNINKNFAQIPHFRQRTVFLEELHKSLKKVARNNNVDWAEFKESSEHWFLKLFNLVQQDGNNNIRLNHSDAPTEDSERDGLSVEEHSDAIDDDLNSCSMNQLDTVASCYSLNSSSMGFGTTDSMMESSEDADHMNDDISGIDLKVRIRRYNAETVSLRDDLSRAEDTISALEREIKSTKSALDHVTNKFTRVKKETEDQREMLADAAQREESNKRDLRKLEKAYSTLEKKITELETEKENILNLKAKIEALTKENSELIRKLADYRKKYDGKVVECGYLLEENEEMQNKLCELSKSYQQNVDHLQEKIQELQNMNLELQSKMINKSDSSSSRFSLTPPPYNHLNIHSTPYSNKIRHQDSLYSELKASGYNAEDAKIQELREELSFYNDELALMGQQLDEALQDMAAARNEIFVPSMQLLEPDGIQTLKHKITSLLELVKSSCTAIKAATPPAIVASSMGEDSREKKPDVLPESTKTSYLSDDRLFGSEKLESDLVGSVTSTLTTIADSKQYDRIDRSTSPLPESVALVAKTPEDESTHDQEIIIPIVEALNRIIEIQGVDEEELVEPFKRPKPKQRSILTLKKPILLVKPPGDYPHSKAHVNASGDGPHHNFVKQEQPDFGSPKPIIETTTTEMKTLKSEFKDCSASPDISKLDTRFVTTRLSEKTFSVINPVGSSTEEKPLVIAEVSRPLKPLEMTYFQTPQHSPQAVPRRKLSVYQRSFDIDNLQTPDSAQSTSNEKRRSVSTPDVQESDYSGFTPISKNQLLTTYRCANSSDSSNSPSPKKNEFPVPGTEDESSLLFSEEQKKQPFGPRVAKPVIFAPKFKLPDSTVNQTHIIERNEKKPAKPAVVQGMLQRNSSFGKISSSDAADQSKILSSSPNLARKDEIKAKSEVVKTAATTFTVESCKIGSSKLSNEHLNVTPTDISSSDNCSMDNDCSTNISDSVFATNIDDKSAKTYSKNGVVSELKATTTEASSAASAAAVREESIIPRCSSGASGGVNGSSSRAPAVVRAMSSGEDSSAESECDALRASKNSSTATKVENIIEVEKKPVESTPAEKAVEKKKKQSSPPLSLSMLDRSVLEVDSSGKPVLGRKRSNSCTESTTARDIKLVTSPAENGIDKDSSCQKVTSNTSPQEAIKEDESPKAFPSWSDEKLQESGIASYPDIDAEISENLPEEELKVYISIETKKCVSFSVGLSTDRMTLSKRITLSRRHRDQAEKNFNNEIVKMQQDIKELAPLCVDNESLERVERARLQLEMVARCAHRISCSAETLGAVHQERRVSRAVLLADKYLQTLRAKCEKLANELAETKRILAENNIMLEENLSEMGDDVPRVRYRAVPNNNRTMMARRRASIATISRPLMGSNLDITKEPLRHHRNSVSGRVSTRKASLSSENPAKLLENEKMARTESSGSIVELRDISEQIESRRHSREENNNSLIRTSINNLSTITIEHNVHAEEVEVWPNQREKIVQESANDNVVNSLETEQSVNSYPLFCWLLRRYPIWKPMFLSLVIAFLLGFFLERVVSSSEQNGPPLAWWSIEELLNRCIRIENVNVPKPI
ncbi:uncharacterized protein LOC100680082 isoform X4 [Nasonia vitripennis]|uniref:Uncharacterized protein n=1 Tax=Nasonia vitripennis TaxID=7425 RepID=A0A7M7Q7M4_NASVI|nr:uncharacterized protein LOC100680082 isoform X4 [Nasonia vitripennis]